MGARFNATAPSSKKAPRFFAFASEKALHYICHLLFVALLRSFLSTSAQLCMYLNVAVMAKGHKVRRVIHTLALIRVGNSFLYWSYMVHFSSRSGSPFCIASLAQRETAQYVFS